MAWLTSLFEIYLVSHFHSHLYNQFCKLCLQVNCSFCLEHISTSFFCIIFYHSDVNLESQCLVPRRQSKNNCQLTSLTHQKAFPRGSCDAKRGHSHVEAHTISAIDLGCIAVVYSPVTLTVKPLEVAVIFDLLSVISLACVKVLGT